MCVGLVPAVLQTVMSLSAICFVCAAEGSTPVEISAASFGSRTMIIPKRPLMTWFVEEWWCGWYQKIPGRSTLNS